MSNYNERLDEMLRSISDPSDWISDEAYTLSIGDTKQAITSLIKELVAEAKPVVASRDVIEAYLQNGMAQKAAGYHGRNRAIERFEQNLLKALEEV